MAKTDSEAVAQMNAINETLVKISNETDSLLREIETLKQELANSGGTGGTISAELEAAINAVDTRAHAIDELVPDVQQPEG